MVQLLSNSWLLQPASRCHLTPPPPPPQPAIGHSSTPLSSRSTSTQCRVSACSQQKLHLHTYTPGFIKLRKISALQSRD
ncbi:hypothetical protein PBY51_024705 [Eleginops maclovinus]|uniref:Uncharacterized protein n=1 Tax=Eleginops maclovinus TaxID=56733 RepID=A0AAN8APA5_ELEMC|nr:hypothetical protein PBY51_024705 [Eleginops maclovinus]